MAFLRPRNARRSTERTSCLPCPPWALTTMSSRSRWVVHYREPYLLCSINCKMTVSWESKQFCWSVSSSGTFEIVGSGSGITVAVLDPALWHKKMSISGNPTIKLQTYRYTVENSYLSLLCMGTRYLTTFWQMGKKTLPKLIIKASHTVLYVKVRGL